MPRRAITVSCRPLLRIAGAHCAPCTSSHALPPVRAGGGGAGGLERCSRLFSSSARAAGAAGGGACSAECGQGVWPRLGMQVLHASPTWLASVPCLSAQDYIMKVQPEAGHQQPQEAFEAASEDEDMAAEPSPVPEQAKPRLQSKVAVASPFDPRQAPTSLWAVGKWLGDMHARCTSAAVPAWCMPPALAQKGRLRTASPQRRPHGPHAHQPCLSSAAAFAGRCASCVARWPIDWLSSRQTRPPARTARRRTKRRNTSSPPR